MFQTFEVVGVHRLGKTFVKGVALGGNFQNATVGGAELFFIKTFLEALAAFGHFFFNLFFVLRDLVFNQHIGTIALFRIAVVDERIVERIHVTGSLPNRRVHEDGGVDAHYVFVQACHRLPPVLLDIVFQFDAELSVVVHCAETIVDFT